MGFLNQKLGVETPKGLRKEISTRIAEYDFKDLANDVAPFLMNKDDIKRIDKFREFWELVKLE